MKEKTNIDKPKAPFNLGRVMRNLQDHLKWEEVQMMIAAARCERDRVMIETLAYTGRRISEVLSLTPRSILFDQQKGIFRILKKKTPTEHMFPLHSKLLKDLGQYIQKNNIGSDERIFPYTRIRAYQIIRRAGKDIGMEKIDKHFMHPHIFRHSFAIHFLKTSKDTAALKKLQQLLYHSDISMTADYSQFADEDLQEEIEKM